MNASANYGYAEFRSSVVAKMNPANRAPRCTANASVAANPERVKVVPSGARYAARRAV